MLARRPTSCGGYATRARPIGRDRRGANLAEYILVVGVIAMVAVAGYRVFGRTLDAKIRCLTATVAGTSCGSGNDVASSMPASKGESGISAAPQDAQQADHATADVPPGPPSSKLPQAIRDAAKLSPTAQHALDVLDQYDVKLVTRPGGGSFYSQDDNQITLDPTRPAYWEMIHELNHAEYKNSGKRPDPTTMSRSEWISAMVDEEVEGDVRSIQAEYEVRNADLDLGKIPSRPKYYSVYETGMQDAKRANPTATEAQLQAAGREAARQKIRKDFETGALVQSTDGRSYFVHYGQWWDEKNNVAKVEQAKVQKGL